MLHHRTSNVSTADIPDTNFGVPIDYCVTCTMVCRTCHCAIKPGKTVRMVDSTSHKVSDSADSNYVWLTVLALAEAVHVQ